MKKVAVANALNNYYNWEADMTRRIEYDTIIIWKVL